MKENLPNHVAIILDGNGRWAKKHNLPRKMGHKKGSENIKDLSLYIFNRGISVLSVFVFSTENFKRSKDEVDYLMNLFVEKFNEEFELYKKENIKVLFSGRKENLSNEVLNAMNKIEEETKNNTKGIYNICLNYGGQSEIVDAYKKMLEDNVKPEEIDENLVQQYLYQPLPPIDLLIRTSGEYRISNFMLYSLAYSELYFTDTYFPDFKEKEFEEALKSFNKRERRFGGRNNES